MKFRSTLIVIFLLIGLQSFGQDLTVNVEDGYVVTTQQLVTKRTIQNEEGESIAEASVMGDSKEVSDAKAQILEVITKAKSVDIYADDINRNPVELLDIGKGKYLIPSGVKLWIEVRAIDFKENIYESKRLVVKPLEPTPVDPEETDVSDSPFGAQGLRVLMVVESATAPELPSEQLDLLFSERVRDFLNQSCELSPDGVPEWRILDPDSEFETPDSVWEKALQRDRESLPWVIISNGTRSYEGKLPASADELIELVKKYQ